MLLLSKYFNQYFINDIIPETPNTSIIRWAGNFPTFAFQFPWTYILSFELRASS